jgi:hypothetical protein
MRWVIIVGLAVASVLLTVGGAFADGGSQVWLQPADPPGSSPTGEARVGCDPITIWAQGDAAGDGTWAALTLAAAGGSGAQSVIGQWSYAGGPAAQVAEVGALPAGRYRLVLYGALARERVVTVDCNRGPAAVYAPVIKAAPLAATGGGQAVALAASGDTVPVAELTAVPPTAPPSGLTGSPIVLGLLAGLLLSITLIGWSFARR